MSAASTLDQVRAITAEHLCHHVDNVGETTSFSELGGDSLDTIELAMALEDHFGIEIDDDEVEAMGGVADAVRLVERKLGDKAGA